MINVRRCGAQLRQIHNFARRNDSLLLMGLSVVDLALVVNMSVSRAVVFNTLRARIRLSMAIGAHGLHTQTARSPVVLESDIEPELAPIHSKLTTESCFQIGKFLCLSSIKDLLIAYFRKCSIRT